MVRFLSLYRESDCSIHHRALGERALCQSRLVIAIHREQLGRRAQDRLLALWFRQGEGYNSGRQWLRPLEISLWLVKPESPPPSQRFSISTSQSLRCRPCISQWSRWSAKPRLFGNAPRLQILFLHRDNHISPSRLLHPDRLCRLRLARLSCLGTSFHK